MKEKNTSASGSPPQVLDSAVVLSWARVDSSVRFTGRLHHFVDGQRLGAVSSIAIVQGSPPGELDIVHCDASWQILAISPGGKSVAEAKKRVATWYDGIGTKWVDTGVTPDQATDLLEEHWAPFVCSFCSKNPTQFASLIQAPSARICNECVSLFHQWLAPDE